MAVTQWASKRLSLLQSQAKVVKEAGGNVCFLFLPQQSVAELPVCQLPIQSNGHIVLGIKFELGGNRVKLHRAHGCLWIVFLA